MKKNGNSHFDSWVNCGKPFTGMDRINQNVIPGVICKEMPEFDLCDMMFDLGGEF